MYDELNTIAARLEHQNQLHQSEQLLQAIRCSDVLMRRRRALHRIAVWRAWAKRERAAKRPLARDASISRTLVEER